MLLHIFSIVNTGLRHRFDLFLIERFRPPPLSEGGIFQSGGVDSPPDLPMFQPAETSSRCLNYSVNPLFLLLTSLKLWPLQNYQYP